MLLLLAALAHAAPTPSPLAALPTDIAAERVLAVGPEAIFPKLTDLTALRAAYPADCIGAWELGARTVGEGATAAVRYDIAMMHRRLTMTVSKAEPNRYVDLDHPSNKGFVTRFVLEPTDAGTRVTMTTWFGGIPKLLLSYYHKVMLPEWQGCQARTLESLARMVGG